MAHADEFYDGYDDSDDGDLHEKCVDVDDVVQHVCEHHWDEIKEIVRDERNHEWLKSSRPWLEILSIVSRRDRDHLRQALRRGMEGSATDANAEQITENQLFAIAADATAFFEELPSSENYPKSIREIEGKGFFRYLNPSTTRTLHLCAESCALGGDLKWASDLLILTRMLRDLLAALAEGGQSNPPQPGLLEPLTVLNSFLRRVSSPPLVYWQQPDKQVAFGRLPDHDSSKLATCLASWISDYVSIYFPSVNLAVCFECGKFFSRERRDNVYCSKTCQNRVAYKRKKIFESGALSRVNVSPDDVWEMKPGLWIHHPRLGVGLIENVEHGGKTLASMLDSAGAAKPDPRYKSFMARTVRVRSRFLHSVRILGFSDLFEPQKKEEQLPTFHEVKSAETLTELL